MSQHFDQEAHTNGRALTFFRYVPEWLLLATTSLAMKLERSNDILKTRADGIQWFGSNLYPGPNRSILAVCQYF